MRCAGAGLKDISRMVTNLASLLRGNIGAGSSQKVPFEQELRYVHYYLDLQREAVRENLVYSVEYEDEELLHYLVPRLTIQPLVENAIVHGLEPRRGLGCVSLRLWEEDQSICVRVEDNGVGFDPASLDLSGEAADTGSHKPYRPAQRPAAAASSVRGPGRPEDHVGARQGHPGDADPSH